MVLDVVVITGTLLIHSAPPVVLFDFGSTYMFISNTVFYMIGAYR